MPAVEKRKEGGIKGGKERALFECYEEEAHNVALNNQNIYVSYSGDYKANPIIHVHNSCELLFFEEGGGEYKIRDQQYQVGKNRILIIGGTDPHFRKFTRAPAFATD